MVATEDKTYQGWTNYATWATHLHLTNEEDIYKYWVSRAKAATRERYPDLTLADSLKRDFEELTNRTMDDLHIFTGGGFVANSVGIDQSDAEWRFGVVDAYR